MDTEYLKKHLGKCLIDCLTEVSEKRPLDPIEYIAQWLYKYMDNVQLAEKKIAEAIQLKIEQEEFARQQERDEKMKLESEALEKAEKERLRAEAVAAASREATLPSLREMAEPQEAQKSISEQVIISGDTETATGQAAATDEAPEKPKDEEAVPAETNEEEAA